MPFIEIGTHGDRGGARADVVLPGAAHPEKSASYVNTKGRVQMATRASLPPDEAREVGILRALSDVLGKRLRYDSLAALRQAFCTAYPSHDAHRPDHARPCWRHREACRPRRIGRAVPLEHGQLLFHKSDRAFLCGPSRMLSHRARAHAGKRRWSRPVTIFEINRLTTIGSSLTEPPRIRMVVPLRVAQLDFSLITSPALADGRVSGRRSNYKNMASRIHERPADVRRRFPSDHPISHHPAKETSLSLAMKLL
jgi:hypothetical protein